MTDDGLKALVAGLASSRRLGYAVVLRLLAVAAFAVLAVQGHVPRWLFGVVAGRDLAIACGMAAHRRYRRALGRFETRPMRSGRAAAALQAVLLLLVAAGLSGFEAVARPAAAIADPAGFVAAGAATAVSGLRYLEAYGRRAAWAILERRAERRAVQAAGSARHARRRRFLG